MLKLIEIAGGRGRSVLPLVFPHPCAQLGTGRRFLSCVLSSVQLSSIRPQVRLLGPFSRIINSRLCSAWPTEQPPLPHGPQGPCPLPLHPSLRQGLPSSVLPVGSQVSIRCAITIATCLSSPGSCCWEVWVWATEGAVQWPGIKGHGSVLGLSSPVG